MAGQPIFTVFSLPIPSAQPIFLPPLSTLAYVSLLSLSHSSDNVWCRKELNTYSLTLPSWMRAFPISLGNTCKLIRCEVVTFFSYIPIWLSSRRSFDVTLHMLLFLNHSSLPCFLLSFHPLSLSSPLALLQFPHAVLSYTLFIPIFSTPLPSFPSPPYLSPRFPHPFFPLPFNPFSSLHRSNMVPSIPSLLSSSPLPITTLPQSLILSCTRGL